MNGDKNKSSDFKFGFCMMKMIRLNWTEMEMRNESIEVKNESKNEFSEIEKKIREK